MKLQPPHLELNLYFAHQTDAGFHIVLKALLEEGAKYHKSFATVLRGDNVKNIPLIRGGFYLDGLPDITMEGLNLQEQDLNDVFQDDTMRVISVNLIDAIGLGSHGEILQYGLISEEASREDHPPIQIVTSGEIFSLAPELEKDARRAGKKVYRKFINLIDKTRPTYAAITVEDTIKCPTDLKRMSAPFSSSDFYLDADFLGQESIAKVRSAYERAYIQDVANGIYVSSWRINPKGKSFDKHFHATDERMLVSRLIVQNMS